MGFTETAKREEIDSYKTLERLTKNGVTQSDIVCICGMTDKSPHNVWLKKMGRDDGYIADWVEKRTYWENKKLKLMAEEFTKLTAKEIVPYGVIADEENKFYISTNGYTVVDEDAGMTPFDQPYAVDKEIADEEEMANIFMACQWNMLVTGYSKWYAAVLYGNQDFSIKEIERSAADIEMLAEKARKFVKINIRLNRPPDADESYACKEAIRTTFNGGMKKRIEIEEGEYELLISDMLAMKKDMDSLKKRYTEKENKLKMRLGNIEKANVGRYFVTWIPEKKTTIDKEKFYYYDKMLYIKCLKEDIKRPLKIKELEENGRKI